MVYKERKTEIMKMEKGEKIEGILEDMPEGNYGPLFLIKKDDGTEITLGSDTVLISKLRKNDIGKRIRITCLGEVPSPKRRGKTYRDYKVEVEE